MDLVGALGLPQLPVEAQGLRVRIDGPLDHVPLARRKVTANAVGILGCPAYREQPPID